MVEIGSIASSSEIDCLLDYVVIVSIPEKLANSVVVKLENHLS